MGDGTQKERLIKANDHQLEEVANTKLCKLAAFPLQLCSILC